jgi:uncharacterized protein (DUF1697 family)
MPRYVALFRGINVGKAKRIAMADLRALLAALGYTEVTTLLNSGNAVFTGTAEPNARHASRIRAAVAKKLGVDAVVIVKSAREIGAIVAGNALAGVVTDASRLLVAVVQDDKTLRTLRTLMAQDWRGERLQVGSGAAYLWCANGILESPALEKLLAGLAGLGTTRNWATLGKIHALMDPKARPGNQPDGR